MTAGSVRAYPAKCTIPYSLAPVQYGKVIVERFYAKKALTGGGIQGCSTEDRRFYERRTPLRGFWEIVWARSWRIRKARYRSSAKLTLALFSIPKHA